MTLCVVRVAVIAFVSLASAALADLVPCSPDDPHAGTAPQSSDFSEKTTGNGVFTTQAAGPITPAIGQPPGALSGRIVFTSGGHGWTADASSWYLQRSVLLEMDEDYGNVDQMNFFADYCFNAGATVVPMRPLGNQTNEVVLDNDDAGVTYTGAWSDSTSTIYYGSPGDVPYRFASLAASETATATYTPNLPVTGFYPVYTWVRHGSDRTGQLYRIRHTGGESLVRVPHYMVGNGWVYLGTYYFNAGSNAANGAVVISNLQPSPTVGSVIIADAIRFGNGMGSVARNAGLSGYPREEECSRYWVQTSLGQGQAVTLYDPDLPSVTTDDQNDNVGAPPRMAREMNREASGNIFKRVLISFHSNAAGGRGVLGLYNDPFLFPGTSTSNQFRLAQLTGQEVNDDLVGIGSPPLEVAWFDADNNVTLARSDFAFGEIRGDTIGYEMDATIIEVAYHDNSSDAQLLRDPKARNWVGRAAYQGVLRYMNEFDAAPLVFLPEPPVNPRATGVSNGVQLAWSAPVAQAGSDPATGYVVYQSTNGYGFGNPVGVSGVGATSLLLTNIPPNADWFFRVAATNAGGESFPTETIACRRSTNPAAIKVLLVNAFDRFDRTINLRQTPAAQNYKPPGHDGNSGTMDRVVPRWNNAFDYVVAHALAVGAANVLYDSCQNEAASGGQIVLTNYPIVAWACGNESTADESFSSAEQTKVAAFLAGGGNLFVSGSEIAWDLDRGSGPTTADRNFLHNQLHATYAADSSGAWDFGGSGGSLFAGNTNGAFDNGSKGIYRVGYPDVLTPTGTGTVTAIQYTNNLSAAISYNGTAGGGKVVYLGFPFETISSASTRNAYMADVLSFFTQPLRFESITALSSNRTKLALSGPPGVYTLQTAAVLNVWGSLTNLTNTASLFEYTDGSVTNAPARFYRAKWFP